VNSDCGRWHSNLGQAVLKYEFCLTLRDPTACLGPTAPELGGPDAACTTQAPRDLDETLSQVSREQWQRARTAGTQLDWIPAAIHTYAQISSKVAVVAGGAPSRGAPSRIRTCVHGSGGRRCYLAKLAAELRLRPVCMAVRRTGSSHVPDHGRNVRIVASNQAVIAATCRFTRTGPGAGAPMRVRNQLPSSER
jgi:hypothetical protein